MILCLVTVVLKMLDCYIMPIIQYWADKNW